MRALRAVLPRQMVLKEWKGEERKWLLVNGHEFIFRPASAIMEGVNACGLWFDEAHDLNPDAWANYQARVRDPFTHKRLIVVSGLPERGWLDETFERPEHANDPERLTIHVGTKDNPHLPSEVLVQLRSSISYQQAKTLENGAWRTSELAAFYEFDSALHVVDDPGDRQQLTHLALDVGDRCAVLFAQVKRRHCKDVKGRSYVADGLHIVDEIHPLQVSTEEAVRLALKRGWTIGSQTIVCVDPRTSIDQIESIRRVLGNKVSIIRKQRGQYGYEIDDGVRAVNAALRDADGNVRLTFSSTLPRTEESLIRLLPKAKRRNDGTRYVKDQKEHALDGVRYLAIKFCPARGSKPITD